MTAKVIPLRPTIAAASPERRRGIVPERRATDAVRFPKLEEIERAMPWLMQGRGPKGHNF